MYLSFVKRGKDEEDIFFLCAIQVEVITSQRIQHMIMRKTETSCRKECCLELCQGVRSTDLNALSKQ